MGLLRVRLASAINAGFITAAPYRRRRKSTIVHKLFGLVPKKLPTGKLGCVWLRAGVALGHRRTRPPIGYPYCGPQLVPWIAHYSIPQRSKSRC